MDFDVENILPYSPIILAAIAFILTLFDKENQIYENYQKLYYNQFLVAYSNLYKRDPSTNPIYFYYTHYTDNDNYLPPYVKYLISEDDALLLQKVLIVDYFQYYPSLQHNFINSISKILVKVMYILFSVLLTVSFITITFIFVSFIYSVGDHVINHSQVSLNNIPDYWFYLIGFALIFGIFLVSIKLVLSNITSIDDYTLNKKKIGRKIRKRKKEFSKLANKYYV